MITRIQLSNPDFINQIRGDFAQDGFINLMGFLSAQETEEIGLNLASFINHKVPSLPSQMVFFEDKSKPNSLKQIQKLFDFSPFFHALMFGSKFEELASKLLSSSVVGKNLQYFNKPPAQNQSTPPHQDGFYFKIKPMEALTMWLALDEVNDTNGCIRYLKGSHKSGLRAHTKSNVLGFSQGIQHFDKECARYEELNCYAKPGDLLVHHALTIHRADRNHSQYQERRALGFIYYSREARENQAAYSAYQDQLIKELKTKKLI